MESIVVTIYYILFAVAFIYSMYFAITGLFGFKNYHKSMFSKHKAKYPTFSFEKDKIVYFLVKIGFSFELICGIL